MTPVLYGYHYSVYTWIARLAFAVAEIDYAYQEIDPFEDVDPGYLALNPFQRVPTLLHDGVVIYETAAIARYIDELFNDGRMQRGTPLQRARMSQIISIVDVDGYRSMVRQVFAQGCFRALEGEVADQSEIAEGLARSRLVLSAIENLTQPDRVVSADSLNLSDLHLGPMLDYFCRFDAGSQMVMQFPKLDRWFSALSGIEAFEQTRPSIP